ncbi:DNA circularization N-terminal domain-containing protein [Rhizobium sp. S153]|uniref:DNA circularization N-terminal domain-containing protein n=1 Tax=Ciceribacter sichuanensis TaxID=2949647 RepID=A0ABT0V205_9HYPH|nr:DNA circularization N-terminal domain-containing protein [Ciceribacter sp. S153]MCM2399799.1 DNA circularization N-terminal domain-containing protein [Ciceribacter sp. S153]
MRDWAKTLRRASYRGVSFWVDMDEFSGGKDLARHRPPGGRFTYIEEMGLATPAYDVTAYLVGDLSDGQAKALEAACNAAGPGRLVLPMDSGQLAYVEGFRRSRFKDQRGYIAFAFTAIPAGNIPGAVLGVGDVTAAVLGTLAAAASAFGGFF